VLALPGAPANRPKGAEALTNDLVERSKENLVRLVGVRAQTLGLKLPRIDPCVVFGAPAHCLLEEARTRGAALIVVGTHGRRGLEHLLLGSVAEEVVREASCSVLVARAPAQAAREEEDNDSSREEDFAVAIEPSEEAPPNDLEGARVLSEPHLDAGRVVLPVLDVPSNQVFLCSFEGFDTVRVDPLEGDWVPQPSSESRARAARAAIEEARQNPELFTPLFEELARRRDAST
jgi:hypothetical protein